MRTTFFRQWLSFFAKVHSQIRTTFQPFLLSSRVRVTFKKAGLNVGNWVKNLRKIRHKISNN